MQALCLYAGPTALRHIQNRGLQAADIGTLAGAAGGPKGLILGPLDRLIFGEFLAPSTHVVNLVGASIGAWRMATACLGHGNPPGQSTNVQAFERLEHDYIHQHYELLPGQKRVSAQFVSEKFGASLEDFYGGRVFEVLHNPRYRLHVITSRGRHLLAREQRLRTPLGYLGAFLANGLHRKALGAWLERVVFSSQSAPLPFGTADFATRQVPLTDANFMQALQASCSIPFVLQSVRNIPGAPPGAYWDGGITDYHLHLNYANVGPAGRAPGQLASQPNATNIIANNGHSSRARGLKDSLNEPEAASESKVTSPVISLSKNVTSAPLVLYPHFQKAVVPGWLDKGLKWRHKATHHLDNVLLLAPNPDWVRTLPNGKLPDRGDFTRYGNDLAGRVKAWTTAARASQQLADEFAAWLQRPDPSAVRPL